MGKLALVAVLATTALSTPAAAADGRWYAGVEGGLMIVEDSKFKVVTDLGVGQRNAVSIDHRPGVDVDLIAGYDFGAFRAEVESGYKRASLDEISFGQEGAFDADGSVRVLSAMANLMLDFGSDDGWNGFVGAGVGLANARYKIAYDDGVTTQSGSDRDRSIAYQGIAGVRKAVSENVDIGLKYRYFVAPKLDFNTDGGQASTKFRSHSLLASLIFNFGAPLAPPPPLPLPPAPPAPAVETQTCPDGSVILVTEVCPAPPPPPAPEPAPERG